MLQWRKKRQSFWPIQQPHGTQDGIPPACFVKEKFIFWELATCVFAHFSINFRENNKNALWQKISDSLGDFNEEVRSKSLI